MINYEIKLWPESFSQDYLSKRIDEVVKYAKQRGERVTRIEHWQGYSGEHYTWIHTEGVGHATTKEERAK